MGTGKTVKEGFIYKRAVKSGKNWRKRYFVLTATGILSYADKPGDPIKGEFQLSESSQVRVLVDADLGGDSGFCIQGPVNTHPDIYLKWKKSEAKDRSGGTTVAEEWLLEITKVIKLLSSNSNSNRQLNVQRFGLGSEGGSVNILNKGRKPKRGKNKTETDNPRYAEKLNKLPPGWVMKLGKDTKAPDYFVSSVTWEYYNSALDCKEGKPPVGKVQLQMVV